MNYIEYLKTPTWIAVIIVSLFLIMQIIGEILEFKGKVVPEFVKIRKYFNRKKKEKKEMRQTLNEVKMLLENVDAHYSADNITKRDDWMKWVNDKALGYDKSIGEIDKISEILTNIIHDLKNCMVITEEMFVQGSRDRIIDFATKVSSKESMVSREEFNRIFKVYNRYEDFLKEHKMKNGEIDIAYRIINESYEQHMKNHTFMEDIRGYDI